MSLGDTCMEEADSEDAAVNLRASNAVRSNGTMNSFILDDLME